MNKRLSSKPPNIDIIKQDIKYLLSDIPNTINPKLVEAFNQYLISEDLLVSFHLMLMLAISDNKSLIEESKVWQSRILGDIGYPSMVTDGYWVFASGPSPQLKIAKKQDGAIIGGKWLIFVPLESLDKTWAIIKKATQEGKLGGSSKCSTARKNPNANDNTKVICVYTSDWKNKTDVLRVREELRLLGFVNKLSYKSNDDGRYRVKGDSNISKYYI